MTDVNTATFTGHLGRDASIKEVGSSKVTKIVIAVNTGFGDRKRTDWIECSLWGARGEKLLPWLKKGAHVGVTGEVTARAWQGRDGQPKASMELRLSEISLIRGAPETETHTRPPADEGGAGSDSGIPEDVPF